MNLDNGSVFDAVILVPMLVVGGCVIAFLYWREKWPFRPERFEFEREHHPRNVVTGRFAPVVFGDEWHRDFE